MNIKVFQIHKRSVYIFKDIQDKYAVDLDRNIFAISDGATQGYKSEVWAESLVSYFIAEPVFAVQDLIETLKNNAQRFSEIDFPVSDNYALKALESRKKELGSFATFLGAKITDTSIKVISSGDVCGFILDGERISSFPFSTVDELDKDKGFLGTAKILKNDIQPEQFRLGEKSLRKGNTIFLMTDAIARMCLRNPENVKIINTLTSFESFKDFIVSKWDSKELEEDDITIIEINTQGKKSLTTFLPPDDFFFPKEEKQTYSQITKPIVFNGDLTEKEMKEIQEQFNLLNNKINAANHHNSELLRQIKSYKLLSLLSLGLSLAALIVGGYILGRSLIKPKTTDKVVESKIESTPIIPQVALPTTKIDSSKPKNSLKESSQEKVNSKVAAQKAEKNNNLPESLKKTDEKKKVIKEVATKEQPVKEEAKAGDKVITKKDSIKK